MRRALLALAFWTGIGLLFSTQIYLLWPNGDWAMAFRIAMPRWYVWGALTPAVFAVDRRLLGRLPLSQRIAAHIPIGLLFVSLCVGVLYLLQPLLEGKFPQSASRFFLQNAYGEAIVYGLIAWASAAASYAAEARARELQAAQLETSLAEGRLRVLQAQLNPHFLFNTFNTISAFTDIHPQTARTMMAELGLLLRASLDHAGRQEVRLSEELAFLEHYLAIERLRFEDRLTVQVQADPDTMQAMVPTFVLQPLVENAIRHGTSAVMRTGRIEVTARRAGDRLTLRVEDDGVGLPAGWRLEDHGGVGLSNMARRLQELYGAGHAFSINGGSAGGVRVDVAVPLRVGAS